MCPEWNPAIKPSYLAVLCHGYYITLIYKKNYQVPVKAKIIHQCMIYF